MTANWFHDFYSANSLYILGNPFLSPLHSISKDLLRSTVLLHNVFHFICTILLQIPIMFSKRFCVDLSYQDIYIQLLSIMKKKLQSHSRSLNCFYCHSIHNVLCLPSVAKNYELYTEKTPSGYVGIVPKQSYLLITLMMTITIQMHYLNYGFPEHHHYHLNNWMIYFILIRT